MSTRLRKKLPIARPLDKGNPSYRNEINRRRPDSTCVRTSLSFFFTEHAFRGLSFIHFACAFAHVRLDVSFFPLCIRTDVSFFPLSIRSGSLFSFPLLIRSDVSFFPLRMSWDVSLFISATHPFNRLLVMKSREKRPGMTLKEVMRDSLSQSLA